MNRHLKNSLIARVAQLLHGCRHVAVGASSPIPAAGSLLAQHYDPSLRVSMLGSERHSTFTDGGRELFDCAAQGRIDAFFLSGVQIDGAANINLVGTGDYPQLQQRFSGSFGSAYLYHIVPRIILFCWNHSPVNLVKAVDFISAAGPRDDGVWRSGGPAALLTNRCEFSYSAEQQGFVLERLHLGETLDSIKKNTAFDYLISADLELGVSVAESTDRVESALVEAREPDNASLEQLLEGSVLPQLAETYPRFVERYFDNEDALHKIPSNKSRS